MLLKEHNLIYCKCGDFCYNLFPDVTEYICPKCWQEEKNKPQEIVIKESALDLSALQEGEGNKTLYRPEGFDSYIGQEKAKKRLISRINGARKFNEQLGHVFLQGSAGHGKTTLAYIIAKQLGLKFVQTVGGSIKSEQQLVDKIVECDAGVIMVDEIHKLKNRIGNFMLPLIEDFQINGIKIKPFTLIGATTEPGELTKHLAPLMQRFPIRIELEHYTVDELILILEQFHQKKYPQVQIGYDIFEMVVQNARNTPRIALSLLKDYICVENLEEVFSSNQIIKDGYTQKDIKVLQYLNDKPQGASKATISYYLGTSMQNYEAEIEPYLIQTNLIEISSKRKITQQGKDFLKEIIHG